METRPPRALLGNAAFEMVAGSELVLLEIGEELRRRGWACDIMAWSFGDPMQRLARRAGIGVQRKPAEVRPFTYDLVWLQNRLESLLDYSAGEGEVARTLFAFAHLDSKWNLAQPGVVAEGLLGQTFVVTSERAVDRVVRGGLRREDVRMFRNAAPASFDMVPPERRDRPAKLLIVSNHPPLEVLEAAERLRAAGVSVDHWGRGGDVVDTRLLPPALAGADAVLTIGKTVPYALRARRAAYVYDHFGGPGWLRDSNFRTVAERNFSGLCCERRLDGASIAAEILEGYAAAAAEAAVRDAATIAPFRLEAFVDETLDLLRSARTPDEHRARLLPHEVALRAERSLAAAAGHYFAAAMRARRVAAPSGKKA